MSSILASLDMSLDDLIAKKKTKTNANPDSRAASRAAKGKGGNNKPESSGPVRGRQQNKRGGGGGGGTRNQPYGRSRAADDDAMDVEDDDDRPPRGKNAANKRAVVVKQPQGGKKKGSSSILSRLGGSTKDAAASLGTKILVKNLKFDISEADVRELFNTVGTVTKTEIVYDRSGRSNGLARVWFARKSDAEKAVKQYDGRTLDGHAMQITLDDDKNVRKGLFGTALRDSQDVKFKVSFGGNVREPEQKGRGHQDPQQRGGRSGGGRGGRGGGRDRERRAPVAPKSAADLDNEMDTYMKDA